MRRAEILIVTVAIVAYFSLTAVVYSFGRAAGEREKPRLSGNCGPAAQGLTPEGNVVPIKVDFGGYAIPSAYMTGQPRP